MSKPNSKIENDLGGVASILADWFGGEGAGDALRDATNIAKKATAGIPNRREGWVPPARQDEEQAGKEGDAETLDMLECPGCGTFFVGLECGGCGWKPIPEEATTNPERRGNVRDPKWFVAFEKNGKVREKFAHASSACEMAEKIGGYVRVLRESEIRK